MIEKGSPEVRVFKLLGNNNSVSFDDIKSDELGPKLFGVGKGNAVKNGWIKVDKKNKTIKKRVK